MTGGGKSINFYIVKFRIYVYLYTTCSEIKLSFSPGGKHRYKHLASKVVLSEFMDCLVSKNNGLVKVSAVILRAITQATIEMMCYALIQAQSRMLIVWPGKEASDTLFGYKR